jgi:hypothetical protein
VAIPARGRPTIGPATMKSSSVTPSRHTYTIHDTVYRTPHDRWLTIDDPASRLIASDDFPRAGSWHQLWHLDPRWRLTRSTDTVLEFEHPSGRHLRVGTTGRVVSVIRGVADPIEGWHAPRFGTRVPAAEITISDHQGACVTTFTVT